MEDLADVLRPAGLLIVSIMRSVCSELVGSVQNDIMLRMLRYTEREKEQCLVGLPGHVKRRGKDLHLDR